VKAVIFEIIQDDGYLMERLDAARQNGWSLWFVAGEVARLDGDGDLSTEVWRAYVYGSDLEDALQMAKRRFYGEPGAAFPKLVEDNVCHVGEID
jgi:hypothetical protein